MLQNLATQCVSLDHLPQEERFKKKFEIVYWFLTLNPHFLSWRVPISVSQFSKLCDEDRDQDVEFIRYVLKDIHHTFSFQLLDKQEEEWVLWSQFLRHAFEREVLALSFFWHLGFSEPTLAAGFSISRGAVKSRLSTALERWSKQVSCN